MIGRVVLLMALLFLCLLIHEGGHVIMRRVLRYSIKSCRINGPPWVWHNERIYIGWGCRMSLVTGDVVRNRRHQLIIAMAGSGLLVLLASITAIIRMIRPIPLIFWALPAMAGIFDQIPIFPQSDGRNAWRMITFGWARWSRVVVFLSWVILSSAIFVGLLDLVLFWTLKPVIAFNASAS